MTDVFSQAKRRLIMQAVRRKGTAPEAALARRLRELGVRYRRNVRGLPGKPDFVIPKADLVVFVHGCFWHGHEVCKKGCRVPATRSDYWRDKIERNRRRDRRVTDQLRRAGYRVFTVWECELRQGRVPSRLRRVLSLNGGTPATKGLRSRQ